MKAIPASQYLDDPALWRESSRTVTDAKRRYELARGVPDEDENGALDDLLAAIGELEAVHDEQGIHERRLIGIVVGRTGALPPAAGTEPIRAYQNLVGELNQALHGDTTPDAAREFWARCLALLRQLFLPPDIRHTELDALASVQRPNEEDVAMLLPLIVGPNHLRYFLSRLDSPAWLDALNDTGILDPPGENRPWLVFTAVNRLSAQHAHEVANWLAQMYARHGSDVTRAFHVAQAAVDLGSEGADLVVQVVGDHPSVGAISSLGVLATEALEPSNEFIESLADILLNDASWRSAGYVDPLLERLVDGINKGNAGRRLQILAWKFRTVDATESAPRWVFHIPSGSFTSAYDDPDDRFSALVRTFARVCSRAVEWVSVTDVVGIVDTLPERIICASPDTRALYGPGCRG